MQDGGGACSCVKNACMHGCALVCTCVSISAFLYACVFPATEALNVMCASVCACVCVCVCVCVAIREQASDWKEPGAVEMPRGQPREGIFYQSPHTLYTQIHTRTQTHTHTACKQIMT